MPVEGGRTLPVAHSRALPSPMLHPVPPSRPAANAVSLAWFWPLVFRLSFPSQLLLDPPRLTPTPAPPWRPLAAGWGEACNTPLVGAVWAALLLDAELASSRKPAWLTRVWSTFPSGHRACCTHLLQGPERASHWKCLRVKPLSVILQATVCTKLS